MPRRSCWRRSGHWRRKAARSGYPADIRAPRWSGFSLRPPAISRRRRRNTSRVRAMTESAATASPVRRHRSFSPGRILTIAGGTFTQLVRMKVFSFLAIFAFVVIGASFAFADLKNEQELKMLKDLSLAAMALFCSLFAIAGTALLIPKDVEDRTLYTILCKPVPRLEYLLGKLMGVIWLIFISLVCMDVIFCTVLHFKEKAVVAQQMENLQFMPGSREDKEKALAEIHELSEKQ